MQSRPSRLGGITDWNLTPSQAIELQKELRSQVKIEPFNRPIRTLGGADISFNRFSTTAYAVFVVLDAQTYKQIDSSSFVGELRFPYIPGLLSFREIPLLLEAWQRLKIKPDLLFMDGQGIAHPRRLGIASHFGVLTDFPTLGCAKSRLVGYFKDPAIEAKSYSDLRDKKEKIGIVYRTKRGVSPIYVSPGHRIDFETSLQILDQMKHPYRIPEPTRQAHIYANQLRTSKSKIHLAYSQQTKQVADKSQDLQLNLKEQLDIPRALHLIRKTIQPYPKAAMFELAERGYTSLFQQLVGCMLSIRTLDEVSLAASLKLFELAQTPKEVLKLPNSDIRNAISSTTFWHQKVPRIKKIAQIAVERYQGNLPCRSDIVLSLPGIGPKCASLALGISCGIPAISVDTHVFRVTRRWGYSDATSPEKVATELESKLPKKYWTELNSLLVPFGKNICTYALPQCSTCPVLKMCQQVGVKRHR